MPDDKDKHECETKDKCQKPEELTGEPKDCTAQQIEKCHGSDKGQCCTESDEK